MQISDKNKSIEKSSTPQLKDARITQAQEEGYTQAMAKLCNVSAIPYICVGNRKVIARNSRHNNDIDTLLNFKGVNKYLTEMIDSFMLDLIENNYYPYITNHHDFINTSPKEIPNNVVDGLRIVTMVYSLALKYPNNPNCVKYVNLFESAIKELRPAFTFDGFSMNDTSIVLNFMKSSLRVNNYFFIDWLKDIGPTIYFITSMSTKPNQFKMLSQFLAQNSSLSNIPETVNKMVSEFIRFLTVPKQFIGYRLKEEFLSDNERLCIMKILMLFSDKKLIDKTQCQALLPIIIPFLKSPEETTKDKSLRFLSEDKEKTVKCVIMTILEHFARDDLLTPETVSEFVEKIIVFTKKDTPARLEISAIRLMAQLCIKNLLKRNIVEKFITEIISKLYYIKNIKHITLNAVLHALVLVNTKYLAIEKAIDLIKKLIPFLDHEDSMNQQNAFLFIKALAEREIEKEDHCRSLKENFNLILNKNTAFHEPMNALYNQFLEKNKMIIA